MEKTKKGGRGDDGLASVWSQVELPKYTRAAHTDKLTCGRLHDSGRRRYHGKADNRDFHAKSCLEHTPFEPDESPKDKMFT